jgi:hypothetical protein
MPILSRRTTRVKPTGASGNIPKTTTARQSGLRPKSIQLDPTSSVATTGMLAASASGTRRSGLTLALLVAHLATRPDPVQLRGNPVELSSRPSAAADVVIAITRTAPART